MSRYAMGKTQGEWELIVAALEEALDRERERRRKAEFDLDELQAELQALKNQASGNSGRN